MSNSNSNSNNNSSIDINQTSNTNINNSTSNSIKNNINLMNDSGFADETNVGVLDHPHHHHQSSNHNQNTPNTKCNNSTTTTSSQETCLICGDVASGKHYGLRSCEACKAFFKRTVQGKIEYSCPATRECEINKRRRKACQACRFQKCLNMGMLKEGVRLDRVRGGRQKYRRGLSPGSNGVSNNNNATNPNGASNWSTSNATCGSMQGNGASSTNQMGASSLVPNETNRIMTALINCEPEEPTASPVHLLNNLPIGMSANLQTLYILSDLFDRELVSLIGWAKQIPGFSETITLNDQMRLLQSTWAEVIALSIGYRSHLKRLESRKHHHHHQQHQQNQGVNNHFMNTPSPTSSSPASTASSYAFQNYSANSLSSPFSSYNLENSEIMLVFAKDLIIDFKQAVACGAEEIFFNCIQLIKRLNHLKITPKEYILLKAISLTNADVRLENPKATHQLRDLIMNTLYEATMSENVTSIGGNSSSGGSSSNQPIIKQEAQDRQLSSIASPPRPSTSTSVDNGDNKKAIINHRLNQVLLCLPVLRQIDSSIRKFWNDVRKSPNSVPMNKLFEEMLEPCQRIYKSSTEM